MKRKKQCTQLIYRAIFTLNHHYIIANNQSLLLRIYFLLLFITFCKCALKPQFLSFVFIFYCLVAAYDRSIGRSARLLTHSPLRGISYINGLISKRTRFFLLNSKTNDVFKAKSNHAKNSEV